MGPLSGPAAPKLRKQPIPLARSILWKPTGGHVHAPSGAGDAIFVGQAALAALNDHLAAVVAPAGALGFFVGDLCEDPDIGARYLVIDAVVRLTQGVLDDRTGAVVSKIWDRMQQQVREKKGQVLGWYHRHTPLGVELSTDDVETHLRYFDQPWHVALVLADEAGAPAAGFFRAGPDASWTSTCLPFHELLQEDSLRPSGKKRSYVTWRNYLPYNAAADHAGRGAAAPAAPRPAPPPLQPTPPPPPRPRRLTPLPQMLPPLPEPEDEAPPEPLPEEEVADESAAPEPPPLPAPPPLPPRPRPPPAPRPAPGGDLPWLAAPSPAVPIPPPAPGAQPVGWEEQPQPEPEPEPEPEPLPEPVREPRPPWLGPALRRLGRVLWLPLRGVWALLRGVGRLGRRLVRLLGRLIKFVLKLALIVAVLAAVGGTAYWWFFLRAPAKPVAPRAAPRVAPRAAPPP